MRLLLNFLCLLFLAITHRCFARTPHSLLGEEQNGALSDLEFVADAESLNHAGKRLLIDDKSWISSSTSWIDRTTCRWLGLCGVLHLNSAAWTTVKPRLELDAERFERETRKGSGTGGQKKMKRTTQFPVKTSSEPNLHKPGTHIPSYVFEYAPLVYLHPEETYWPSSIEEHLQHTVPLLNFTLVPPDFRRPTVENLALLNIWKHDAHLHSFDNPESPPSWLLSKHNIPVPVEDGGLEDFPDLTNGTDGHQTRPPQRSESMSSSVSPRPGRSNAPVSLVVVEKEDGIVDAFWWYFYSYNLGNPVFGIRFGNHVGDWEHMVVRFQYGKPVAVFFSQHDNGKAYKYDVVEKMGKRPVGYVAAGTHAMYPTSGLHPYILPFKLLFDSTGHGPLWDPSLNVIAMTYDSRTQHARIVKTKHSSPIQSTSWFHFNGHWGDQTYRLDDKRQYRMAGQYHFGSGPFGPKQHWLDREGICQENITCPYHDSLYL